MESVEDVPERRVFVFGGFELDESLLELRKDGRVVELEARPFALLRYLLRHADRVVPRDELLREVWCGVAVTDASVKTAIHEVRRALGDSGPQQQFIATLRGRGYRFCGAYEVRSEERRPPLEPLSAASSTSAAPAPDRSPVARLESVFVDREDEMQSLRAALLGASGGERRIVLLHGPPGIGKTRTATEIGREAEARGFEIHVGRTHECGGAPPLWPWRQILRSLADARSPGELRAPNAFATAEVLQLAPELGRHFSVSVGRGPLYRDDSRFHQLDGVMRFLSAAAEQRPLLLVLDDLHWADDASLALLGFIARNLQRAPILIVATHRELASPGDEERAAALQRVLHEPGAESLALRGLGRDAVAVTLERALRRAPDESLVDEVVRATGGNPFFVSELARLLNEQREPASPGGARLPVPGRLRDTVQMRISERSERCQKLLRCASAIGSGFELALLRRAVDLDSAELMDALQEAQVADFVRAEALRTDDGLVGADAAALPGRYVFAHGLVRDVVYAQLTDQARMRLHARIADALHELERQGSPVSPSELAHHYALAAPLIGADPALEQLQRAAAAARALYAYADAVAHDRRALELLNFARAASAELRCALLVDLGESLCAAEAPIEQVHQAFSDAIKLARTTRQVALWARAAVESASYARLIGETASLLGAPTAAARRMSHIVALEEVLACKELEAHPNLRARVLLARASIAYDANERELAARLVDEVLVIAERCGDSELRARARIEQFTLRVHVETLDQRVVIASDVIAASRECSRVDLEYFGHGAHAFLALTRADRDGFEIAAARIERLWSDTNLPSLGWAAHTCRSLRAQLEGRLDDARRAAREGARMGVLRNMTWRWNAAVLGFQTWWLARLRGRVAEMVPLAEAYQAQQHPAPFNRLFMAHVYAEAGRLADARRQGVDCWDILDELPRDDGWFAAAMMAVELCAMSRETSRAPRLLELLLPHADRGIVFSWIVFCAGSLARPLGSLAAMLGRTRQCDELFEMELDYADSVRAPMLRLWTQLHYAAALEHDAGRQRALRRRALVIEAKRLAQELGVSGEHGVWSVLARS